MRLIQTWVVAARPHTLSAGVVPILVGSALAFARHQFSWPLFWLTLAGGMLVQIGANLVDEAADHQGPGSEHKFPAPHKVIARGLLTPRQVGRGAWAAFGLATLIGGWLVVHTGWPLLVLCLASLAVAYAYSAGPLPLGDYALGEPLVFVFMGPVMVGGTLYVQAGGVDGPALTASLPVGALVTAILMANNLRDVEEDQRNHRRTLATLLGPSALKAGYAAMVVLAYGVVWGLAGEFGYFGIFLPWLALPLGLLLAVWAARGGSREQRHKTLKLTSLHHLLFGVLWAAALALGADGC